MKNSKLKIQNTRSVIYILFFFFGFFAAGSIGAQSTNQNYPTPITGDEVTGKIAARDLGDARLTNYYYVFGGAQGDVFVNLKTENLDGDIDIFTADNLRPLTKITVFSDAPSSETGRIIYLRKPEKLILRIQGRSPDDRAAVFSLKFAGSFTPAPAIAESETTELPEVKTENQTDTRVNSVGTIIEVKPKQAPKSVETVAENEPEKKPEKEAAETKPEKIPAKRTAVGKTRRRANSRTPGNKPKPAIVAEEVTESAAKAGNTNEKTVPAKTKSRVGNRTAANKREKTKIAEKPNPLESVRLLILLKDGTQIERPMSEVSRVGVDKGVLTLITKDGAIKRFMILDVARMTIE